jgi:hypothetical protein
MEKKRGEVTIKEKAVDGSIVLRLSRNVLEQPAWLLQHSAIVV